MLSTGTRVLAKTATKVIPAASFSTAKAVTSKPPAFKPIPTSIPKPLPPASKAPPAKQPKKDSDLSVPTPVIPFSKPPQPFAKKPAAQSAVSRVPPPRPPTTPTPYIPTYTAPEPISIPDLPIVSIPFPSIVTTPSAGIPPAPPVATATSPANPSFSGVSKPKAKKPAAAKQPAAPPAPGSPAALAAQKAAVNKDLAGRSPQQLLTQIAQLQQHNATLQGQLVYHSAVEAIYGETGFNQLRNLISEFSEEEALALKTSGFDGDSVIQLLETRQRELCLQFTQGIGADLSKHITSNVKRLKDQHRQSASAATATQQTLRNAGVPDAVIANTLISLQPHLDDLQIKIVRWEKLKADIDLLLATYAPSH